MQCFSAIHGLTAELRGYQCKAIQWMLDKERGVVDHDGGGRRPSLQSTLERINST